MPSLSPGEATPSTFAQVLPGTPTDSLQTTTTYTFRWKRYIVYISGKQLNILRSATELVQALTFEDDLIAVKAEGRDNGRIAIATASDVWVLGPQTNSWNHVTWRKALLLTREDAGDEARSICWGNDGELLVGGRRQLSLFNTLPSSREGSPTSTPRPQVNVEERRALWSKDVPSPVQSAVFSPSAGLIASYSHPDRLVKIWRRLSFEEGLFDYAYLPHPGPVTHLEWRSPDPPKLNEDDSDDQRQKAYNRQDEEQEVLYTFCTDGVLRTWKTGSHHDLEILTLHTTLDLVSAIPHSPTLASNGNTDPIKPARYAFILPSGALASSIRSAIAKHPVGKLSHSAEHLKEVGSKHPDVVVTLDGHGRMSAWGLQSVGHKRRPSTPSGTAKQAYHIAHAEDIELKVPPNANARFEAWFDGDSMNLLMHSFGGSGNVQWWRGSIESFFSPAAPGKERVTRVAHWSGDAGIIADLNGSVATNEPDGAVEAVLAGLTLGETPTIRERNSKVCAFVSADGKEFVIVDRREGYLEHRERTASAIKLLKLAPAAQGNLLAVAYAEHVDILGRTRYQERDTAGNGIWRHLKRIFITGIGLEIKIVQWFSDNKLALAAGNGAFVDNALVDSSALDEDIQAGFDARDRELSRLDAVAEILQSPLPVWHPDMLQQLALHSNLHAVTSILTRLEKQLKFYTEGDELHPTLELEPDEVISAVGQKLDQDIVAALASQLEAIDLPRISRPEQRKLKLIVETAGSVQEHIGSLDVNALRYLFSWQLRANLSRLEKEPTTTGDHVKIPKAPNMSWRDIAFAFHSDTQQPFLEILNAHYGKSLDWTAVRNLGIPAWVRTIQAAQSEGSDLASLEQIFETLAQSSYRASYPPDPARAALYFLALRKKPTLLALWRVAVGNREQKSTMNFLKRDFSVEENKTAARKNAYALMGKRRFEYAAAFFLLADDAASAIRILAGQCEDLLLAIAVARVYCGDGSTVLCTFVNERVIPTARKTGDRWLLSWAQEIIGDRASAGQALVVPFDTISEAAADGGRRWQQDDPLTLQLYHHLRTSSIKPGRSTSLGTDEYEYTAVLRSARILRRMGMWVLALDLVGRWTFNKPTAPTELENSSTAPAPATETVNNVPSMLDGFASDPTLTNNGTQPKSMLDDFASPTPAPAKSMLDEFAAPSAADQAKRDREAKAAELMAKLKAKKAGDVNTQDEEKKKAPPTQFKEPEASSILDSFGF